MRIRNADDVYIDSSHENPNILKIQLSINLIQIVAFIDFKLCFDRTHLFLFGPYGRCKFPNSHNIKMNSTVSLSDCALARYRRVEWDYKLDWSELILNIKNTERKLSEMLSSKAGFEWGARLETLLTIFKTLIRPKIDWGRFFFTNEKNYILKCFDFIRNSALRIALRCMRTTSINNLHYPSEIEPLKVCRNTLTAKFPIKSMASNDNVILPRTELLDGSTSENQRLSRRKSYFLNTYEEIENFSHMTFRYAKDVVYTTPIKAFFFFTKH